MFRAKTKAKLEAALEVPEFEHSSQHGDLLALLAEHTFDDDASAATAQWRPSRRGNSPRAKSDSRSG